MDHQTVVGLLKEAGTSVCLVVSREVIPVCDYEVLHTPSSHASLYLSLPLCLCVCVCVCLSVCLAGLLALVTIRYNSIYTCMHIYFSETHCSVAT